VGPGHAVLEAISEDNRRLYQRHGFAIAALPSQATHYWETEAECDTIGSITLQVVNVGWGAAKVKDTKLTLLPRLFEFKATHLDAEDGPEVIVDDSVSKRQAADDVCRYSWEMKIKDDPYGFPDGTYLLEGAVGVKVVGR
jgi:hypothetical protein